MVLPFRLTMISLMALCLVVPVGGFAAPPDWAPAHGWRKKNDHDEKSKYKKHKKRKKHGQARHRDDRDWDDDYRDDRDWDDDYRDRRYSEHDGKDWPSDYGVIRGECDRQAIGAVLGGVVGGVVGSRTSSREDRKVAILLGGVIGAVIGAEIGRRMDNGDRACMGHALELSTNGRPVSWRNDQKHAEYILTPLKVYSRDGRLCRDFDLSVSIPDQRRDVSRHQACRGVDGRWKVAS